MGAVGHKICALMTEVHESMLTQLRKLSVVQESLYGMKQDQTASPITQTNLDFNFFIEYHKRTDSEL